MNKLQIVLFTILAYLNTSCGSKINSNTMKYCGYELTGQEFAELRNKIDAQKSAYDVDSLWNIYDQMNDSIRAAMPDSIVFEIFLSLLNENEVAIDVFVPRNTAFFEKISCAVMNITYSGKMPEQRYLCLYSYTNPDGSGDIPFEVAIKRKN